MASYTEERYMNLATEIYLHLIKECDSRFPLSDYELSNLAKRADDAAAALAHRFEQE
jgi:hypothetical protein